MSKDSEIQLEPFFNEDGRLFVRCKESKRVVSGLVSAKVSNDVDTLPLQYVEMAISIEV